MKKTILTEKRTKSYTVTLGEFSGIEEDTPLEAAKNIARLLCQDDCPNRLVYDIVDEEMGDKFTVDLAEEDEDTVLPN
jgi:hypothetical protein